MSKTRVCGGTCHKAKGSKCRCWCGGVFHGGAGELARAEFAAAFKCDKLPTTERLFAVLTGQRDLFTDESLSERWRERVASAVVARTTRAASRTKTTVLESGAL